MRKRSKNRLDYAKALFFCACCLFASASFAQNDAVLIIKGQTLLKSRAKGLGLNQGVKSVQWKEEAMEGVTIEVKKNGNTIATVTSEKKGKYSFQIPVSTTDVKNDYSIYFTKEGMAPRLVMANAFLAKAEFAKYPSASYSLELDVPLIATTVKDIAADKAFAKIKWDNVKEHKFSIDATYEKLSQGEEHKIEANPDQYYTALAKKKQKQEEASAKTKAAAEAKLKAAEEAKRKADEEAKKLVEMKAAEEAKRKADEEARKLAESLRIEAQKKRTADSLAEIERKKALEISASKVEIKKNIRPVQMTQNQDEGSKAYDAAETYSINTAKKLLSAEREKRNREKGKNLTMKYETTNVLTSLLNEVDDFDKKSKKQ